MKAAIFAGAQIVNYQKIAARLQNIDVVICCDSGIRHAKALDIVPDYIVGDFDSADPLLLQKYQQDGIQIRQYPTKKDETDLALGLTLAIELGIKEVDIFGGIGNRLDHTLANAQLLYAMLKRKVKARLINENNQVEVIQDYTEFYGKKGDLVSLIPLSMQVKGVTTYGLEYPLTDAVLQPDSHVIAISNVMMAEKAAVDVKEGFLFLMRCSDE